MIFRKWGGGEGSKAVWNFSEVSSVLVCPSVPYGYQWGSRTARRGIVWFYYDHQSDCNKTSKWNGGVGHHHFDDALKRWAWKEWDWRQIWKQWGWGTEWHKPAIQVQQLSSFTFFASSSLSPYCHSFILRTSYHEQNQTDGHNNHVGLGWTLTHEKKDLQPRRNILQLCLLQKMASIEQRWIERENKLLNWVSWA